MKNSSGDVALDAADDLPLAQAFLGVSLHVGAGTWVEAHPHEHDAVALAWSQFRCSALCRASGVYETALPRPSAFSFHCIAFPLLAASGAGIRSSTRSTTATRVVTVNRSRRAQRACGAQRSGLDRRGSPATRGCGGKDIGRVPGAIRVIERRVPPAIGRSTTGSMQWLSIGPTIGSTTHPSAAPKCDLDSVAANTRRGN